MSLRAQQLESEFRQANQKFMAFVEELSDDDLRRFCPEEQRTLAALARHVASAYLFEVRYFQGIVDGQPLPVVVKEQLDQINAENGERNAHADRGETLEMLRQNGETAARFVAGLTDEQLSRTGEYIDWVPEMSVEHWVERVMIGHIHGHMASMRAIVDQATARS